MCHTLLLLLSCVLPCMQAEEIASTAKFGDLIEFSYPIGYSHWGVYVEDGNVIHFAVAGEDNIHTITSL